MKADRLDCFLAALSFIFTGMMISGWTYKGLDIQFIYTQPVRRWILVLGWLWILVFIVYLGIILLEDKNFYELGIASMVFFIARALVVFLGGEYVGMQGTPNSHDFVFYIALVAFIAACLTLIVRAIYRYRNAGV